jgi:hypothetical protein
MVNHATSPCTTLFLQRQRFIGLFSRKKPVFISLKTYILLLIRQQQLDGCGMRSLASRHTENDYSDVPSTEVPIELEKEVVVLDYPLPDLTELNQVLSHQLDHSKTRRTLQKHGEAL